MLATRPRRLALFALLVLLLAAAAAVALKAREHAREYAANCPAGYVNREQRDATERRAHASPGAGAAQSEKAREKTAENSSGGPEPVCFNRKHPESLTELATRDRQATARETAPASSVRSGAYASAAARAQRMGARASSLPGAGADWTPAGSGPLVNDDPHYPEVNGVGLADLNGRISDFATTTGGALYAAVGEGGVWTSADRGGSWRSIGDKLPVQAVGSVGWSPAAGGTVFALTGDSVFGGGSTYAGTGLFRTTDDGQNWQKASGLPDGVLAFKVVVDPTDPNTVYAATGAGLFRSTDDGASFSNADLPTGGPKGCTGASPDKEGCFLANMVTDVAVQQSTGAVVAAVGWRAGNKPNPSGYPDSPSNGIYKSPSGNPGTFDKTGTGEFPAQNRIGRIELGAANGPDQDHQYLYAIVQDAVKFNGGAAAIDIDTGVKPGVSRTVLNGIYVSSDFGDTWTRMEDGDVLGTDPTNGSALTGTACATLYCPGVQAWYNEWIKPDPTRQDASGVPTRLLFGLEEVWQNKVDGQPQDGPSQFEVVGPYFAGDTCLFLSTGLPACPTTGDPTVNNNTTTHPDQHSATFLPSSGGGSTIVVGNDGGAYTQTAGPSEKFSEGKWGRGANQGFNTLLPYDAQISKNGTIFSGLQDNGEMKIEPGGRQVGTFGGDGGFSAVDPDNSDIAYEEYTFAAIKSTTNGGQSWQDAAPPADDGYQFINPFTMDPADPNHLLTAGRGVYESTNGPSPNWTKVYDLGTRQAPGNADASPNGTDDSINKVSAVDLRGAFTTATASGPSGPKTADFDYTGGEDTVPGADGSTSLELPGTFTDRPFTIKAGETDARAILRIEWTNPNDDWDLRVLKKEGGTEKVVGESLTQGGASTSEQVSLTAPKPGDYIIRAYNYAAPGRSFKGSARFVQAIGTEVTGDGAAAYVGFCGYCDALNVRPFGRGLATNVGGSKPPKRLSSDGWHIAAANGLPNRYITSVQMDPADPRTVYVTLGGYSRRWLPVNKLGENTPNVGSGHVFKSTDSGQNFTDISGNLPDAPANFTLVRDGRMIVATDVGVFIAAGTDGGSYDALGNGLPTAPVYSLELKPGDANTLIVATQGRGVYRYSFTGAGAVGAGTGPPQKPSTRNPVACAASRGFASATASRRGRGVRFAFQRRARNPVTVDVFQQSHGRKVLGERRVAHFTGKSRSFTWNGKARKGKALSDGVYFARYRIAYGSRLRDFRRITLQRSHGRFSTRPSFYRAESCGLLSSYKLGRPVFGGSGRRTLGIAYRLSVPARVKLEIFRGSKRIRSDLTRSRLPRRTYRSSLLPGKLRKGDYRVRLTVRAGATTVTSTLVSRRL